MTLLLALVAYALYSDIKRAESDHKESIIIGRAYGEALWRATSAQRWWAEYSNSLEMAVATDRAPESLAKHFQFFAQNLRDALGNTNSATGFTDEAKHAISVLLSDAEDLHSDILMEPRDISQETLAEVVRIKRSIGTIASRLGTFEYLAVTDFGEFDKGRHKAALVSAGLVGLIIVLTGMGLFFYRRAVFAEATSRKSRLEIVASLSSGHSHAIASITAGMQIYLDLMHENKQNKDEAFSRIQQGLTQLINLNTGLALISSGQDMKEHFTSLEQCLTMLSKETHPQRTKFKTIFDKDIATLPVPSASLGIVLRECLANAYRFSAGNSDLIEIRASKDPLNLNIEILDRGSGLTGEVLAKATQPFFSTSGVGHSGLGLASCLSIVERLGGSFSISNRKQGGARVFISIPLTTCVTSEALPSN